MQKKLTITIDEKIYENLRRKIGPGRISRFIEGLLRPHVLDEALDQAYAQMAEDKNREKDALEWVDSLAGDAADDPR